jgi:hypothetical protein
MKKFSSAVVLGAVKATGTLEIAGNLMQVLNIEPAA